MATNSIIFKAEREAIILNSPLFHDLKIKKESKNTYSIKQKGQYNDPIIIELIERFGGTIEKVP